MRYDAYALLVALAGIGALLAHAGAQAEGEIVIQPQDTVCDHFMGFGAQWDIASYRECGVTDADWAVIEKRVRWMRPPVMRIMMLTRWCSLGDGKFDWETPEMKWLYRQLDLCQELNTTVLFTDWGGEKNWTRAPGIKGVDDPYYAEVIGTYMDHLLNTRKYTCIKYFILTNEPNWEVNDWDKWKRGIENVAKVFAERGLDKRVAFAGSDTSQAADNDPWHRLAVDQLSHIFQAYDVHRYANDSEVRPGQLEPYFRAHWEYAQQHDPNGKQKPCIVGEAGMNDDAQHPHSNLSIAKYKYGVFMADYAVQAARAGSAAVSAWMLDDNCHKGFAWGLWDNAANGLKLRPWFFPWSLLVRSFPKDAVIYRVAQPSSDIRILAARIGAKWSFCVVNRGTEPCSLTLRVPDAKPFELQQFVYTEKEAKVDADGFPIPVSSTTVDLAKGLTVTCPGDAVVIYAPASLGS